MQLPEAAIRVGANRMIIKKILNEKQGEEMSTGVLESSHVPGNIKGVHVCRGVHILRNDLRSPLPLSPIADLEVLHKQGMKTREEV